MGCRGCRVALVVGIISFVIISFAIVIVVMYCCGLMNAFVLVIVAIAIAIIIIILIIIHPIHLPHLLY